MALHVSPVTTRNLGSLQISLMPGPHILFHPLHFPNAFPPRSLCATPPADTWVRVDGVIESHGSSEEELILVWGGGLEELTSTLSPLLETSPTLTMGVVGS